MSDRISDSELAKKSFSDPGGFIVFQPWFDGVPVLKGVFIPSNKARALHIFIAELLDD
jgi:hypothetical protein